MSIEEKMALNVMNLNSVFRDVSLSAKRTTRYMEILIRMQKRYQPDKRRDNRLKRRGPCGHKWSHYDTLEFTVPHSGGSKCHVCGYWTPRNVRIK